MVVGNLHGISRVDLIRVVQSAPGACTERQLHGVHFVDYGSGSLGTLRVIRKSILSSIFQVSTSKLVNCSKEVAPKLIPSELDPPGGSEQAGYMPGGIT